jgi:hypothetical protein
MIKFIKSENNHDSINKNEINNNIEDKKENTKILNYQSTSINHTSEDIKNMIINENNDANINNWGDNSYLYHTEEIIKYALDLSKEFKKGNKEIKNKIFNEIIHSDIFEISKNQYGNYLIQAILTNGDEESIKTISDLIIQNNIIDLSLDPFGCRVLQTLIDIIYNINKEKIQIIIEKIKSNLYILFTDKYGNHFIQKIIEKLNFDEIKDLYNFAFENHLYLIYNQYGSYILEAIISKCNEENAERIIKKIINENNFINLCRNKYSNYVLQSILKRYPEYNEYAFQQIKGKIYYLSLSESGSKIVQIVFDYINNEKKDEIGKEIIDSDHILDLANDKYGNFVIQKIIEQCSFRQEIIQRLLYIPKKERTNYWKYVNNIMTK